jgi:hypothetical protein
VTEAWKRRGVYRAGAGNVVGDLGAVADPGWHFAQLYGAALSLGGPVQEFFFRAAWINVIAWGLGYALAGRRPAARAPVLIAGGAGKLAYFGACLSLVAGGVGGLGLLASAVLDVIFAGFVASVLWSSPSRTPA